jgi:hypothetical protein
MGRTIASGITYHMRGRVAFLFLVAVQRMLARGGMVRVAGVRRNRFDA